jgi:hypothetical protein
MAAERGGGHDAATVPRLVLLWQSPLRTSPDEAGSWARAQVAALAGVRGIEEAALSRLRPPSADFNRVHDWMLELRLSPGRPPAEIVTEPALVALLADLRQLGLRPAVLAAGEPASVDLVS